MNGHGQDNSAKVQRRIQRQARFQHEHIFMERLHTVHSKKTAQSLVGNLCYVFINCRTGYFFIIHAGKMHSVGTSCWKAQTSWKR